MVGEGQTETAFVQAMLAEPLADREIILESRLIRTSPHERGGALTWSRVSRFLRNTLRERADTYVTTFFDLYRFSNDFPGGIHAQALADPEERAQALEQELHRAVVQLAGCRVERFVPHIQPFEFESLLFSDIEVFPQVEPEWHALLEPLRKARRNAASPEHINDGAATHPSALLETNLRQPAYKKVSHGAALSSRIGVNRMRQECPHFAGWLARIEQLTPLRMT